MGLQPTLYDSLILPLRALDEAEGGLLLRRYLERPQYHVDRTRDLINTLPSTDSPITCPDALVQYLASHVGFTSEMSATLSTLTIPQLRKLLMLAMPFWRKKGTVGSVQAIARHLTGRIPNYISWFDSRLQLDVSAVAEDQMGADSFVSEDAYWSCLEMMDDGTINTGLLLALLRLVRPTNEELQVILYDFLDTFAESLDRWSLSTGVMPIIEDGVMECGGNCTVIPMISTVPTQEFEAYTIETKVMSTGAAFSRIHTMDLETENTNVSFYLQPSASSAKVIVRTFVNNVNVLIYSGDSIGLDCVNNVWYTLRIEVSMDTLYNPIRPRFKMYLDNILQYEGTIDFPYTSGRIRFGKQGTGAVSYDNVRIWRVPMRYATIGPTEEEVSATF